MTFEEAINLYLEMSRQLGHSSSYVNGESFQLHRFAEYCRSRNAEEIQDVTPALVIDYQKWVRTLKRIDGRIHTVHYQNRQIRLVWLFGKFLADRAIILIDFGRNHATLRDPDRLPRGVMNKEQMMQMLREPATTIPMGYHDRTLLELMFSTGLRGCEVCKLTVYDVNLDERLIRVIQGKGRKDRIIPFGKVAGTYLREYLQQVRPILLRKLQHVSVFLKRNGSPLHVEHLQYLVRKYRSAAKLSDSITTHSLRHTCATEMLRGGASVRHVQELLGHSSIDTTQIYTRLLVGDLKRVHKRTSPSERRKALEEVHFGTSALKWRDDGNSKAWHAWRTRKHQAKGEEKDGKIC